MFVAGLQIAAPVVVASLFADVALGFIGKASPQLPVLFVGISIKNLLGLALMCGAVAYWPRFFDARFGRALDASERILKLATRTDFRNGLRAYGPSGAEPAFMGL